MHPEEKLKGQIYLIGLTPDLSLPGSLSGKAFGARMRLDL